MEEAPVQAIEMLRSIRDQLYEETRRMTPDELMELVTRESAKVLQPSERTSVAQTTA
jgi:DNA polymerase II large subunit